MELIDLYKRLGRRRNLAAGFDLLPNGANRFIADHAEAFFVAPGSGHNHQTWPGGLADHLDECFALAGQLYQSMNRQRTLVFSLNQVLLVLFLHDIEKVWKRLPEDLVVPDRYQALIDDQPRLQALVASDYNLPLTDEIKQALRYIHGEGDDYRSDNRTATPLSAFCHSCDYLSARVWFDEPATSGPLPLLLSTPTSYTDPMALSDDLDDDIPDEDPAELLARTRRVSFHMSWDGAQWIGRADEPDWSAQVSGPTHEITCDRAYQVAEAQFGPLMVWYDLPDDPASLAQIRLEDERDPDRLSCPLCNSDHPDHQTALAATAPERAAQAHPSADL
jgi:hypothetical protein